MVEPTSPASPSTEAAPAPGAPRDPRATAEDAPKKAKYTFPLAEFEGARPSAPAWFDAALAAPHTDGAVSVEGADIVWRRWDGPPAAAQNHKARRGDAASDATVQAARQPGRGLIFVPGGLAHLGWWDFIAPFFADAWTPVALSLSGMGASDHREIYRGDTYADEIIAVAEAAGLDFDHPDGPPMLIGHSFGAFMSLWATGRHGDRLGGAVLLDVPVHAPKEIEVEGRGEPNRRGGRSYPSLAATLARFRLMPDQDCENLYLLDHIARAAIHEIATDDGPVWTWRHDPDLWLKREKTRIDTLAMVAQARCPLAFIRGAQSALVHDALWAAMREALPAGTPMVTVPIAEHHLLLDQPLATVSAIAGLLSGWPQR